MWRETAAPPSLRRITYVVLGPSPLPQNETQIPDRIEFSSPRARTLPPQDHMNPAATAPFSLPRKGRGRMSRERTVEYEFQVERVSRWMQAYRDRLGFAPVARSWLYAFESEAIITKGDFAWASKWLAENRKAGLIPFELVGSDTSRDMSGFARCDDARTPRDYINERLRDALDWGKYWQPNSYWKYQTVYPIVWTEKRDLLKLFQPSLPSAVRRFPGKGWADVNSRVAVIQECMRATEFDEDAGEWHRGLEPVILYCGDHDPAGLQISDFIHENLREIAETLGWGDELDEMHEDGRIVRFGLDAAFIEHAGLTWIDGLETSSGGDLADPKHPHHSRPYVQDYLAQFGARKVESNALIANPVAAQSLMRRTIWEHLDRGGHDLWIEDNKAAGQEADAHAEGIRRFLAMMDAAGVLHNPRQLGAVVQRWTGNQLQPGAEPPQA